MILRAGEHRLSEDVPQTLYVAPHIRHVWLDDRVAILDLRSESYFALDPTASAMWRELASGHDREQRLRNLHRQFSDQSPRLEPDLDAFMRRGIEAGWLLQARSAPCQVGRALPRRRPARRFLTVRAWWSLFRVSRSLSVRGFSWTYNAVSQRAQACAVRAHDHEQILSAAVKAFARVEEVFYLRTAPADCLPRSLALFRFLRTAGLPVEHCIGVQQFPFSAHAWTQFHGRVVHDDPLNKERYTVIASLPT